MKISIITINYNNAAGLERTLNSVLSQTYEEIEHIIVDGASTDNSVNLIMEYVRKVEGMNGLRVEWKSEPDKGIYDAMNKGVAKATCDYCYFLNGGDTLASPTVLQEMVEALDGTDVVIGRVNFSRNGIVVGHSELLSEKDMSLYNMYLRGINHQAALIKRDLLIRIPYDISVKMGADWKFFLQSIVLGGATTKCVDTIFANFDLSGLSSDTTAIRRERESILATIVPERIARDYLAIAPHYYEVIRVEWLLCHPFWYKLYRGLTTLSRKIVK